MRVFLWVPMVALGKQVSCFVGVFMRIYLCVAVLSSLLFYSCRAPDEHSEHSLSQVRELTSVAEYLSLLEDRYGNHLPSRSSVVPLVFARNLPQTWDGVAPGEQPEIFIELLLPEVVRVNALVADDRARLLSLAHEQLGETDRNWLVELGKRYGCAANAEEILSRLDIVPASLVLAQAILESGWGKSRFAREGNALYGEHRPRGSTKPYIKALSSEARVAAFPTLFAATKSYIDNLNSNKAYAELRQIRRQERSAGHFPDSRKMAAGLLRYSERGQGYVDSLRFLIRRYNLRSFDQMKFEESQKEITVHFTRKNK